MHRFYFTRMWHHLSTTSVLYFFAQRDIQGTLYDTKPKRFQALHIGIRMSILNPLYARLSPIINLLGDEAVLAQRRRRLTKNTLNV